MMVRFKVGNDGGGWWLSEGGGDVWLLLAGGSEGRAMDMSGWGFMMVEWWVVNGFLSLCQFQRNVGFYSL